MLKKLNTSIAFAMLVVILITLLAHSSHYTQVEFDGNATIKKHDCALCQQGIDAATKELHLAAFDFGIFSDFKAEIFELYSVSPDYILALLRAPPAYIFL